MILPVCALPLYPCGFGLFSPPPLLCCRPQSPLSVSDSATRRRSVSVCSAHSNADTARTHARTHSGHGVHRGRKEGEGQTDRQSPRAVAVGLSRSTELRLPLPHAAPLLIALRKDGDPTSVPPPPPDHVAPSADRPIGPGAGADLTSVRLSTSPAALLHVLHYTTRSLTHSHSV